MEYKRNKIKLILIIGIVVMILIMIVGGVFFYKSIINNKTIKVIQITDGYNDNGRNKINIILSGCASNFSKERFCGNKKR